LAVGGKDRDEVGFELGGVGAGPRVGDLDRLEVVDARGAKAIAHDRDPSVRQLAVDAFGGAWRKHTGTGAVARSKPGLPSPGGDGRDGDA
jgi:hypothetical protein